MLLIHISIKVRRTLVFGVTFLFYFGKTFHAPDHVLHLAYLDAFAQWLNTSGRHAEAAAHLRRTVAHYRRIEGAEAGLCSSLERLVLAESAIGDIDAAVNHAREVVQIRERTGVPAVYVGSARVTLANVLMAAGRMQEFSEEVERFESSIYLYWLIGY